MISSSCLVEYSVPLTTKTECFYVTPHVVYKFCVPCTLPSILHVLFVVILFLLLTLVYMFFIVRS